MGKKSKSNKKSKKTKTESTEPEVEFYNGSSKFTFPNGDVYEGEFCAHYTGLVWREGLGTYTTKDGHVYTGQWYSDKLVDNTDITIKFPRGATYNGNIYKSKYSGKGCYIFPNKMVLNCDFADNKPQGHIVMSDVNGNPWIGEAEEKNSILLQEHNFYRNIDESRGIGKPRIIIVPEEQSEVSVEEPFVVDELQERESEIFRHSSLTKFDVDFANSDWYQNYMKFKRIHDGIMRYITREGMESLPEAETTWFKNFHNFKKRYHQILNSRKNKEKEVVDLQLYELFHSKEFKTSCPPISVLYPGKFTNEG